MEHLVDGLSWVFAHVPQQDVVIDLAGVCRLDRCGVQALLRVRSQLQACGRTLAVRGESAGARARLAAAGLLALPRGG